MKSHGAISSIKVLVSESSTMRNWKLSLLILSLSIEGVLVTNWVYTAKAGADHHDCLYITCPDVSVSGSPVCGSGRDCKAVGTAQFHKCYPVAEDVY